MFGNSGKRAEKRTRKQQRGTDWVRQLRDRDAHGGYGVLNATDKNHRLLAYTAASAIAVEQLLAAQQETNRLLAELVAQGRPTHQLVPAPGSGVVATTAGRHGR